MSDPVENQSFEYECSDDEFESKKKVCTDRSVYLVTYSQVDIEKVKSREQFSMMVCNEFGCDRFVQFLLPLYIKLTFC